MMEVKETTPDNNNCYVNCILKPRKIPPQNIVHRLRDREIFGVYKPGTECNRNRPLYLNVFPNFTLVNVDIPACYLRKFSPDGKHFLAFSSDQTSVEIYKYMGPAAAADLLKNCEGEKLDNKDYRNRYDVRSKAFERFFMLKHRVNIAQTREHLNRECSLFTEDSRYVIIGAALRINEDARPHFYHIYTNNESVVPNHLSPLEDYSLHLVDLVLGKLCDTVCFKTDKIFLSHNQGICLYKNTLAVLSVQHQTIHIFYIEDGAFIAVRKIGRFCFEDDESILSPVLSQSVASHSPFRESTINALKHRLLAFLFRRAKFLSESSGSPYELRRFYQYFDQFRALRLWKMQLLDDNHLLIKYSTESAVTLKTSETNTQSSFFMVYNFMNAEVLAFFENTSDELLHFFENFCDFFRNARSHNQFICSPSNNIYAR
jgi:de-etiolated-1